MDATVDAVCGRAGGFSACTGLRVSGTHKEEYADERMAWRDGATTILTWAAPCGPTRVLLMSEWRGEALRAADEPCSLRDPPRVVLVAVEV